jgi:hypothetical protein
MGIFDLFAGRKSDVEILDDMIWLTKKVKYERMADSIAERLASRDPPVAVILVAHFRDCLNELRSTIATRRMNGRVTVAAVEKLNAVRAAQTLFYESQTVDVIVGERHPLASHDDAVVEFARRLCCRCRLSHYLSLEDALLKSMASEWLPNLLKRLGMKDDDAIHSRLVSRRIKDCQARIQGLAFADEPADSAQQWIQRNIPPSRRNQLGR